MRKRTLNILKDILGVCLVLGIAYAVKPDIFDGAIQDVKQTFEDAKQTIEENKKDSDPIVTSDTVAISDTVPDFLDSGYVTLNGGAANIDTSTIDWSECYLSNSELDSLGRCGVASAVVGPDSIATEERGSIGMIKPSGWHTQRYDNIISDHYLYNRGHLIMFKLYGNDTNVKENLITETRYANATTQLSFENQILDYIYDSGSKVYYQVTPDFHDDELVARGVHLQAVSEDGVFNMNVYVYNVQPGVSIDYATGNSVEDASVYVDGINTTVD